MSCKKGAAASRGRVHKAEIAAAADNDVSLSKIRPPPSASSNTLQTTSEAFRREVASTNACECNSNASQTTGQTQTKIAKIKLQNAGQTMTCHGPGKRVESDGDMQLLLR